MFCSVLVTKTITFTTSEVAMVIRHHIIYFPFQRSIDLTLILLKSLVQIAVEYFVLFYIRLYYIGF